MGPLGQGIRGINPLRSTCLHNPQNTLRFPRPYVIYEVQITKPYVFLEHQKNCIEPFWIYEQFLKGMKDSIKRREGI